MKIVDINGNEVIDPDLSVGYLNQDKLFVAHHPAVEAVEEQFHYEIIATYPNGGEDYKRVVDVPGVEAKDAWDEYEDVLRYTLYTKEELEEIEERERNSLDNRMKDLEEALQMILTGVTV